MSGTGKTLRWRATPRRPPITRRSAKRSPFARLMKYLLPLIAATLVAVVVGWPDVGSRNDGLRLSFLSRQGDEVTEPGMVNARYIGTDGHNRPFVITAERATQPAGDPDTILLHALQADITLDDGAWLALTAKSGVFNRDLETLRLDGPVSLFSDQGFEFHADTVEVDLSRGTVESDRPVRGQGPLGLLDAGGFRLLDRGQRLFFSDGVKLVVFPDVQG